MGENKKEEESTIIKKKYSETTQDTHMRGIQINIRESEGRTTMTTQEKKRESHKPGHMDNSGENIRKNKNQIKKRMRQIQTK